MENHKISSLWDLDIISSGSYLHIVWFYRCYMVSLIFICIFIKKILRNVAEILSTYKWVVCNWHSVSICHMNQHRSSKLRRLPGFLKSVNHWHYEWQVLNFCFLLWHSKKWLFLYYCGSLKAWSQDDFPVPSITKRPEP